MIKLIELSNASYSPVLDEMLSFYYEFQAVDYDNKKYRAKKFLEKTNSSFDEILNNKGRYFTLGDFKFDMHVRNDSKIRFVENFEKFVYHVVKQVKYILGL